MSIDHNSAEAVITQQFSDTGNIRSAFQQMCIKAFPQTMNKAFLFYSGFLFDMFIAERFYDLR